MLKVKTGTIYGNKGTNKIDITIKSAQGEAKLVAPTWDMVMEYKRTKDEEKYTRKYMKILNSNELAILNWIEHLEDIHKEITFCCFCRPGDFCHRVLLTKWLEEKGLVIYEGEH